MPASVMHSHSLHDSSDLAAEPAIPAERSISIIKLSTGSFGPRVICAQPTRAPTTARNMPQSLRRRLHRRSPRQRQHRSSGGAAHMPAVRSTSKATARGVSRGRPHLDLNPVFRSGILAATSNPLVSRGVQRFGMRLGAASFVAGETFDEAIPVLRGLNQKGLRTNTTLLGEGVTDEQTTRAVVAEYRTDLDRIAAEGLQTNIALKLTHLGLDLDPELAYRNVSDIAAHAHTNGNFIRIDMEESARVDDTLRIYLRLREDGHDNVGTVLQSYLYRTPDDLERLLPLSPNLRLVKGAYLEPPLVAYPRKADVDRAYVELAERMLTTGGFTAIATHDERIIDHVIAFTR